MAKRALPPQSLGIRNSIFLDGTKNYNEQARILRKWLRAVFDEWTVHVHRTVDDGRRDVQETQKPED